MHVPQLIYCLGASVFAYHLARKAENKWLLAAICFWIFSSPILGDEYYPLSIHFAGIDFQPNRILFLFLLATLVLFIFQARLKKRSLLDFRIQRFGFYELWMMIYVWIAVAMILFNADQLGMRTVIVNTIKWLTFPLVYFFARERISQQDFHLLIIAVITFAILSSIVGIYQFFGDSSFFRIGVSRPAFGSYFRGNGFFTAEYDQGIFLTMALTVGLLTIQDKWIKVLLLIILPVGVFCTMHRASWSILIVALGMITIREFRRTYPVILTGAIVVIVVAFLVLNIPLQQPNSGTFLDQLTNSRVLDNTLAVRMAYNRFAVDLIQKYPFGIGDYTSAIYGKEAYKQSMDFFQGNALIIHNGFLSAGVLYGIAGMLAFMLFILTTISHYTQKELRSTTIGFMIVSIMISFIFINATQDFSFIGNQIGLFLALMTGATYSISLHTGSPLVIRVWESLGSERIGQTG